MKKILKKKGFTLAEILITLSIIGIVAAISIPSLLVNINDKTYDAQRNALLARMSQAVGQMDDISSYKKGTTSDQASAVAFITKGLSKVYKISSVCGADHLDSCDIVDTIKIPDSTTDFKIASNKTFKGLNSNMGGTDYFDTDIAAFTTTNGESMIVYYNPNCKDRNENSVANALTEVCVNMIYDLNGSKAPNTFGKDVGIMTIFNPSSPNVVAPVPYISNITGTKKSSADSSDDDASLACSSLNGDLILPDRESMIALVLNQKFIKGLAGDSDTTYWTSTVTKPDKAWSVTTNGAATIAARTTGYNVRCIKK